MSISRLNSFLPQCIITPHLSLSALSTGTRSHIKSLYEQAKSTSDRSSFARTQTQATSTSWSLRIIREPPVLPLITHHGDIRFRRFKGNIHLYQHQSTHIVNFGGDRTVAAGVLGRNGQQEPGRSANHRNHNSSYGSCGLFNNSYKPSLLSCLLRPLNQADSSPAHAQVSSLRFELSGAATQASQLCCMSICSTALLS